MIKKFKKNLLQNNSESQTVVKNAFWLSFSQIVGRGIRAVTIILAARVLGVAEYGVFSYALGLAGFFTLFADLGLSQVLTRNAAQEPHRAREYFATAFWIKMALLFFTALAIIFITPFFSNIPAAIAIMPIVAAIVVFDSLKDFWNAYFRSQEKMEREALVTLITNLGIAIFCAIALYLWKTASSVTVAYLGSVLLGSVAGIILLQKEFQNIIKNFKKEYIKEIIHAAWATAIIGLLGSVMLNVDMVILGWLTDEYSVGLYSAAQKIIQVLYIIPAVIASAIFPTLAKNITSQNHESERALMNRGIHIALGLAVPMTTGCLLFGSQIIHLVFGTQYAGATLTFQILAATLPFVFVGTLVGNFILAHRKQRDVVFYVGIAALGNVVLDYFFIIWWGIAGCALATLIIAIVFNYIMTRFAKHLSGFSVIQSLRNPLIASAVMALVGLLLLSLNIHIIIIILLSIAVYIAMLFATKDSILIDLYRLIQKAI